MAEIQKQIKKRRTFAIISHPDAGKTTLTEKLLLFGGAIQVAGAVKSNKIKKTAHSDFMEIERQRGISVATSVMAFEYKGYNINILDTPGHKDFAEDTYRTLTAVDSVILVIDSVKGVEAQTKRLMEVCAMRKTPVIVFINKLDREGKDPYELLEEIENNLNIQARPLTWPINMGSRFKGVYSLYDQELNLFRPGSQKNDENRLIIKNLDEDVVDEQLGKKDADKLREDVELITGVYEEFNQEAYLKGNVAPVFFGSAINNFGVKELLDTFVEIAPPPKYRNTDIREVKPEEKDFTGFVFKIHANIDPNHRNRIAFLRIVSGKFERNKFYWHNRTDKKVRFSNPTSFMAQKKETIDEAFPGDVVGLYDTGNFKIGDTITEGEKMQFQGIPSFSPEIFKEVQNLDPMKSKQLDKGLRQLTEEGVAQLFIQQPGNRKIIGTVGELQFEVLTYRLENEYGAKTRFKPLNFHKATWVTAENEKDIDAFTKYRPQYIATDKDNNVVFLAENEWNLKIAREDNPNITFHETSEFKTEAF